MRSSRFRKRGPIPSPRSVPAGPYSAQPRPHSTCSVAQGVRDSALYPGIRAALSREGRRPFSRRAWHSEITQRGFPRTYRWRRPRRGRAKSASRIAGPPAPSYFYGMDRDKENFYRSIDIFCLPSRSESFSITLVEAMAHGCPVVASRCDGPSEIVEHGVTGRSQPFPQRPLPISFRR